MTTAKTPDEQPQLYFAEDLNPEWLEYQRAQLLSGEATLPEWVVATMPARLACNSLEMGINQGAPDQVENAFDDFSKIVQDPDMNFTHAAYYKSRLLLANKEIFVARTARERLPSSAMNEIYSQTMEVLDEVLARRLRDSRDFKQQTDLIAYGAVIRLLREDYLPCFSTFREAAGGDAMTNHDMYIIEYPQDGSEPYKYPACFQKFQNRRLNPFQVSIPYHIDRLAKENLAWFQEIGLPTNHPDTKKARYEATSRLLSEEGRLGTISELGVTVLDDLSNHLVYDILGKELAPQA